MQPWLAVGLRLLLAAVFAAAGASKLPDPAESVRAIRAYRLLPEAAVHAVAYGLPVLELALAALLLLGLVTRVAAVLAGLLLAVFIAGIGSVAARGLSIDCGCFGGGGTVAAGHTRYTGELLRDTGLLIAALTLTRWPASRLSLDRCMQPPPSTGLSQAPLPHATATHTGARDNSGRAAAGVPTQREETL